MKSKDIIKIEGPLLGQSNVCGPILRALPEWFGIEEATVQYIQDVGELPTFLARIERVVVGFMSVKHHYPYAAELYVLGVYPDCHRHGIGRALLASVETYLRRQGVEYLQVKTLSDSHPDEGYAKTRAFYKAVGFRPLEEFKTLWGEANPCLLMVKGIQ
ncbi:MAG: GNAT family N-acetyltransferase [Anaerolineae bacterium]|nr:GNAT family N-acetyltransferase [Anaerolineae bacterium]